VTIWGVIEWVISRLYPLTPDRTVDQLTAVSAFRLEPAMLGLSNLAEADQPSDARTSSAYSDRSRSDVAPEGVSLQRGRGTDSEAGRQDRLIPQTLAKQGAQLGRDPLVLITTATPPFKAPHRQRRPWPHRPFRKPFASRQRPRTDPSPATVSRKTSVSATATRLCAVGFIAPTTHTGRGARHQ